MFDSFSKLFSSRSFSFQEVHGFFSSISSAYDRMNDVMSLGLHQVWKQYSFHHMPWSGWREKITHLDMACGSGDVVDLALHYATLYKKDINILGVDPNEAMLEEGRRKIQDPRVKWLNASAETAADHLTPNSIDLYTIFFGLRNVTDRHKALETAFSLLKPGGIAVCLEFCPPHAVEWGPLYHGYLYLLQPLGALIAQDGEPYAYLRQSICGFPAPCLWAGEWAQHGFQQIRVQRLTGGVAALLTALKPEEK